MERVKTLELLLSNSKDTLNCNKVSFKLIHRRIIMHILNYVNGTKLIPPEVKGKCLTFANNCLGSSSEAILGDLNRLHGLDLPLLCLDTRYP